ncbi:hypothetical protein [Actinacidiphila soli]|uniref:hypothetical protein n=1 Tax=Actinacidiphila soli TaxID=2487275 RepID=UPI0013E2BB29|nr:hypothetical protein [Actinacidiphila soli]
MTRGAARIWLFTTSGSRDTEYSLKGREVADKCRSVYNNLVWGSKRILSGTVYVEEAS